jgi:hypothetical protein
MKLLTKEIEAKLPKLYATEGTEAEEKIIVVKFFNPTGAGTWYAVEGERDGDDFRFFGLVDLHEREWGYFMLSELQEYRGRFGLKIERDLYFNNVKAGEVLNGNKR